MWKWHHNRTTTSLNATALNRAEVHEERYNHEIMNEEIAVRFHPELRDQIRASMVLYRASIWRICDRIAGTIAVVAGVTLFVLWGWKWWLAILIPVALSEWSDFLHLHTVQAWIFFKRNPKFRGEYILTFHPEGLHFKTTAIDSTLGWSYYDNAIEDSAVFVLSYGKSMCTVIPKRAFRNEDEVIQFRNLIQSKISKYQRQRF